MSDLERAVYELAEVGALDAAHAVLYARPIGKLARAGLLTKTLEGVYEAVRAATDTRPPRATIAPRPVSMAPAAKTEPAPPPAPMETIVAKVPAEWVPVLDAMGPSRSEAIRRLLGKALMSASGARLRKTGS
jgi:hypothetical protein